MASASVIRHGLLPFTSWVFFICLQPLVTVPNGEAEKEEAKACVGDKPSDIFQGKEEVLCRQVMRSYVLFPMGLVNFE